MSTGIALAERGLVPEALLRWGIRRLLKRRLHRTAAVARGNRDRYLEAWTRSMRSSSVALVPETANEQHYEVPAAFFERVLGDHRKYSSCYYPTGEETLSEAESAMLALTCERADLHDGQRILELGCGWGSLTLWMAERYPASRITAVSNSASQRASILERARERGLDNIEIITCDMNEFAIEETFDRMVSIEMFEHMRNWEELLGRVRGWLADDGKAFIHVFAHRTYAYPFETDGRADWMARYFFTGGMMPSADLLREVDIPFEVEEDWVVDGTHYARTSEHWLDNLERERGAVWPILEETYGAAEAERWYHRWRLFFLACAELFGYADGQEWVVSHTRLSAK